MRILVAGATGAIGRRLLPMLVDDGHEVTGLTRSADKAAALRIAGADAAVVDVFDAPALQAAVHNAQPEIIVSELTDLPARPKVGRPSKMYAANNRVRTVGNATLLAAARAVGTRRIVLQSVAFWYRPVGGAVKTEDDPLDTDAAEPVGSAVRAMKQVEDSLGAEPGIEAVILRYGFFYGPGTWYATDGFVGRALRRRRYPIVGSGQGIHSLVHIDDAARATVAALSGPPGCYNIVDDEPAPAADWVPALAAAPGGAVPGHVPAALAGLLAGRGLVSWMETLRGADNSAAKMRLGWRPDHPSWRQGFATEGVSGGRPDSA